MNSSRVLRFRAWNHADKKMLYHFFIASDGTAFVVRDPNTLAGDYVEVIPDIENVSVEQYTGLHDINSKEVFEGDILRIKCEGVWQVPLYEVTDLQIFYADTVTNDSYVRISGYEVIGNIHENPDLLEVS